MEFSARRLATFDDLLRVPDGTNGEILAGELVLSPRPAPRLSFAHASLLDEVVGPFQKGRGGPGGWVFLTEPELHLGDDALVPDIAGWRRERLPRWPKGAALTLAPDWVCEILSPRTEAHDRGEKARIYAREGVGWCWLINPTLRTLDIRRLEGGRWVVLDLFHGDGEVRAEPFDAVPLALGELWSEVEE